MSLVAVIHVGSGSVSGALLDGKKIIFATEAECRFQDKLDPQVFSQIITDSFRTIVQNLASAKLGSPARVAIFLSSPFVAGRLNRLKHRDDKQFKVTEKLIANLVAGEADKFKQDSQHRIVDNKIMRFTLNGYETATPHGQKANGLEIFHYLSLAPRGLVDKLTELTRNAFHHDKLEFHSASFASFLVLRRLRPAEDSFLILDISAELTELALVWQSVIWETLSYPLGSHSLLRERVGKQSLSPAIARAALEQASNLAMPHKLSLAQRAWLDELERSVLAILQHRFWSGDIVLVTEDATLAPLFATLLQSVGLEKTVFSSRKINVEPLTPEMLGTLIDPGAAKTSLPLLVDGAFMLI